MHAQSLLQPLTALVWPPTQAGVEALLARICVASQALFQPCQAGFLAGIMEQHVVLAVDDASKALTTDVCSPTETSFNQAAESIGGDLACLLCLHARVHMEVS